jgi:hypothetical protein
LGVVRSGDAEGAGLGNRFAQEIHLVNSLPCERIWPSNMGNCPQS